MHAPLHTLFPYNPRTLSQFISLHSTHPFTLYFLTIHAPLHKLFLTVHSHLHNLFPYNPHTSSHIISLQSIHTFIINSLTIHSHIYSLSAYNSVTCFHFSLIIHCSNPRKHVHGVTDSLKATTCLSKCFADFSTSRSGLIENQASIFNYTNGTSH